LFVHHKHIHCWQHRSLSNKLRCIQKLWAPTNGSHWGCFFFLPQNHRTVIEINKVRRWAQTKKKITKPFSYLGMHQHNFEINVSILENNNYTLTLISTVLKVNVIRENVNKTHCYLSHCSIIVPLWGENVNSMSFMIYFVHTHPWYTNTASDVSFFIFVVMLLLLLFLSPTISKRKSHNTTFFVQ
jgi:hypothetical protein